YEAEEGARFEVHLDKARGVFGIEAAPFEARLETTDTGADIWTVKTIEDITSSKVKDLTAQGYTVREIAEEIGISKSKVSRIQQKLKEEAGTSGTKAKNGRNPTDSPSQASGTTWDSPGTSSVPPSQSPKGGTVGQACKACDGKGCPHCKPQEHGIRT